MSDLIDKKPETHDKRTETHACDCISRKAAIDALGERPLVWDEWADEYSLGQRNQYDADKSAIEALPPAQPERIRGEWVEDDDGWDGEIWRCSECDAVFTLNVGTPEENGYNFCPNCGADMRGEDDE